uniref:Small ribosomal subunit protein uS10 n=1 Tax=Spirometra erinaceieuropaei TaxID=99802 RepID=A0A0F6MV78_SPIER|nr:40S ribosomal protein S20 [Spirometra erinaceieuropaei]
MAGKKQDLSTGPLYWVRITLTSAAVKPLEKVAEDVKARAKDKNLKLKGPIRLPTKTLRITTRKTPCGEGSKTWDRYQMRIHKRVLDLFSNSETVQQLTLYDLDPMVRAEVKIEGGDA